MDFTYVWSWAGRVYIAFILDLYSQRMVAWHAPTTKRVDLVMIPLRIALWGRGRQGHPITPALLRAHSDAGSQYAVVADAEKLALDGVTPSIGLVGNAFDNALMETMNGLFKIECVRITIFHEGQYKAIAHVEYATSR